MKILFITNHLNGNDGWSRYGLDIVNEIKSDNKIFCLVNKISERENNYELMVFDKPFKYLANPIKSFKTAKAANRTIKDFSPDIIYFVVEPYITILPFLRLKNEIKVILTVHGTYSYFPNTVKNIVKRTISWFLFKRSLLKVNKIISVSNFTKDYLLKNIRNKKFKNKIENKIEIVTNGVNFNEIKQIVKKDNEIKQILFVGAIKGRKGLLESIEALKCYRDNFSDNFVYNIIGEYDENDNYYQKVILKIKKYQLEKNIFFRGRVSDEKRDEYYKEADLFLMLPVNNGRIFEGFGLVFLEANAVGIPCVGSNDSGSREAILDEVTGYVVDPNKESEIADEVDKVLNKKLIKSDDCIKWAKENNIKNKVNKIFENDI